MKVYVLNVKVFGSFAKNCGTGSEYISSFFTANGILKFRFKRSYASAGWFEKFWKDLKDFFPGVDIDAL